MKIVEIQRFPIALRTREGSAAPSQTIVVRIRTESGLAGLGEAAAVTCDAGRTLSSLIDWLKSYEVALIGADALNINVVNRILDRVNGQHPGCQAARAAIDMAVHDLVGKARGCPVHELLGGAYRTEFELFADVDADTVEEAAAAALSAVGRGYRGLKVAIGDALLPPAQTAAKFEEKRQKLIAVVEAVGPDIYVDADANQSLGNPALASSMVETIQTKRFRPNLALQQPLDRLDFKGHAFLRQRLPIAVILKESVVSPEAMMQIERLGAADRIVLSIDRVGGMQSAMRIADICEAAAIGVSPAASSLTKIGQVAHCHLAAALHDSYPIEIGASLRDSESPVTGGFEIRNGRAILGGAPGLGVELDDEAVRALTVRSGG